MSSARSLPADALATDFDYEVTLEEIDSEITISRRIDRNSLPFAMGYTIGAPDVLNGYQVAWDTDK